MIHESNKEIIDEKTNPTFTHEKFERPVVTTEIKKPIVE